jgi:plastocyanin
MWQHPLVRSAFRRGLLLMAAFAAVSAPMLASSPAMAVDQNVSIVSFAFQPADVSVALNEKVTWFNQSPDQHTVTSDSAAFDSGALPGYGGGYQLTFQRSGDFAYHCAFHPQMHGIVHVAGGAGGGGGVRPPPVTTIPTTRPPSPPTSAPGGSTPPPVTTPPAGGATTTSTIAGATTTSSTTSSSTTSTTSLFSPPTTRKGVASSSSSSDNDRTKRRVAGAIAAALAAAATLAVIFFARRPAVGGTAYDAGPYEGGPSDYGSGWDPPT